MERIVYLERESIIADVRRPSFAHEWIEYPKTAPGQVIERLQGASIAIVNKVPLPAAAGTLRVGVNGVDQALSPSA